MSFTAVYCSICFSNSLLQASGDLEDLKSALEGKETKTIGSGSCSAIIKLLPHDLLTSHDTWTVLNSMTRILKKYDFRYHETADPSKYMWFTARAIEQIVFDLLAFR